MSDDIIVKNLVKQLKLFRETVLGINRGGIIRSNLIPPSIREQAGIIFSQHGGLDILMDVLHVSADQIKTWSIKVKKDPEYYKIKSEKLAAKEGMS